MARGGQNGLPQNLGALGHIGYGDWQQEDEKDPASVTLWSLAPLPLQMDTWSTCSAASPTTTLLELP